MKLYEAEEFRTSWRCRWTQHHLWAFPQVAYGDRKGENQDYQACARPGCDAVRILVTPSMDTPTAAVRRYLKPWASTEEMSHETGAGLSTGLVMSWDWGEALDVEYPAPREET